MLVSAVCCGAGELEIIINSIPSFSSATVSPGPGAKLLLDICSPILLMVDTPFCCRCVPQEPGSGDLGLDQRKRSVRRWKMAAGRAKLRQG